MEMIATTPPQNVEAEMSVLSSCMHSNDVLSHVCESLTDEHFHARENRKIFHVLSEVNKKGYTPNITLMAQDEMLEGMINYLGDVISASSYTLAGVEPLLKRLDNRKIERDCLVACTFAYTAINSKDDHETKTARVLDAVHAIGETVQRTSGLKHIRDIIPEASEHFKDTLDGKVSGIKTGIADFDRETGGLFLGEYTIVSGRPADGKTTVALNMARSIAEQGHAVGIFSIEMQGKKLTNRFACMLGDGSIKNSHIRGVDVPSTNALNEYMHSMDKLSKLDIYIDDSPKATNNSIMSSVRSFIRKNKLSVLIIDHFSLIGYDGENKRGQNYERKEEITRGIQKILKELDIAGVILVQLGRDAQNRRPRLSDLSDTKALEQDANNVLMIWNPVHGDKTRRVLCCEKGRDGGSGDYYINFEGDTAKTYSMEPQEQEAYYSEIEKSANHSHRG